MAKTGAPPSAQRRPYQTLHPDTFILNVFGHDLIH